MNFSQNEKAIGSIEDVSRKGKPGGYQAPRKVGLAILDDDPETIILRTEDANGVAPIVICLTKQQAEQLADMLLSAI